MVSWHYTVDDHAIVQHLPDGERAYHAGDGANGPGNRTSIGIELCVNAGGDFAATRPTPPPWCACSWPSTASTSAMWSMHNHWNGKDCPRTIRATPGAWDGFLALCRGETPGGRCVRVGHRRGQAGGRGVDRLPRLLEGGDYSAENVRALLIKWAASL